MQLITLHRSFIEMVWLELRVILETTEEWEKYKKKKTEKSVE